MFDTFSAFLQALNYLLGLDVLVNFTPLLLRQLKKNLTVTFSSKSPQLTKKKHWRKYQTNDCSPSAFATIKKVGLLIKRRRADKDNLVEVVKEVPVASDPVERYLLHRVDLGKQRRRAHLPAHTHVVRIRAYNRRLADVVVDVADRAVAVRELQGVAGEQGQGRVAWPRRSAQINPADVRFGREDYRRLLVDRD